jgi:hypothetical protein
MTDNACLKFLALLMNVCASTALTALWFQHSQIKFGPHHLLQCDSEIHGHLCGIALKKSKPKPFSAFRVHPRAFSEPVLLKNCDSLA